MSLISIFTPKELKQFFPPAVGPRLNEMFEIIDRSLNDNVSLNKPTATAINATAVATAASIVGGRITSTSALPTAITMPTAASIVALLNLSAGAYFDFIVDNTDGADVVTITESASITKVTAVVTGSDTLTVAIGAVANFRIYFVSGTVAKISRLF